MSMRTALAALGVTTVLCVAVWPVAAQPDPEPGLCAEDTKKFCGDVKPGGGRIVACMKEHEDELSPQCKAQREKASANGEAFGKACGADVRKFCAGMKVGGGRVIECLNQNGAALTVACKTHLEVRAQVTPGNPAPKP